MNTNIKAFNTRELWSQEKKKKEKIIQKENVTFKLKDIVGTSGVQCAKSSGNKQLSFTEKQTE